MIFVGSKYKVNMASRDRSLPRDNIRGNWFYWGHGPWGLTYNYYSDKWTKNKVTSNDIMLNL